MEEGELVVVAKIGAEVAGVKIKKTSVRLLRRLLCDLNRESGSQHGHSMLLA